MIRMRKREAAMKFILKCLSYFLVTFVLLFSSISHAVTAGDVAAAATTASTNQGATTSQTLGVGGSETFADALSAAIKKVTTAIANFAQNYRAAITPMGVTLLTGLSVIAISWSGMQMAMTSGSLSEPMNKLITTIFTIGFATWLLSDGYDTFVINGIDDLMNNLVSKVDNGGSIDQMFNNFMLAEFQVIGGVIDKLSEMTLWDMLTKGGFTILLLGAMFLAMLVTSVVGMIAVLTSLIMVAIAMAIGPIFIPFLVLGKTSFLFDGWLKFLINACLTKVVVALLLGIGLAAIAGAAAPQANGVLEMGSMIGSLLSALAISGVIGTLMMTAPGIASAITSGGAIGMDGFAGRIHSTAKNMGRNASVGASQGAGNKLVSMGDKMGGNSGQSLQNLGNKLRSSASNGGVGGLKSLNPAGDRALERAASAKSANNQMVNRAMDSASKAGLP